MIFAIYFLVQINKSNNHDVALSNCACILKFVFIKKIKFILKHIIRQKFDEKNDIKLKKIKSKMLSHKGHRREV